MKYYIYKEESYIACSNLPKAHLEDYKEITAAEYNNYFASLPVDEIDEEEQAILALVEKGYTVYK